MHLLHSVYGRARDLNFERMFACDGAAEGGLKWSPTYEDYEMYAKEAGSNPDSIPTGYSFAPDYFALSFYVTSSSFAFAVGSTYGTLTWVHPGSSSVAGTGSWTYKDGTFLAQGIYAPYDSSYFGVDQYQEPLFGWNSMPAYNQYPDGSRAILNKLTGASGIYNSNL